MAQYRYRSAPSSRLKGILFVVLFLIFAWLTSPPAGTPETKILTYERDVTGTTLFTTIEVQNNTHSPFYRVETFVSVSDMQGNSVGQKTETVATVMFPKARKQIVVRVPIRTDTQDALYINAETTSWFLVRSEFSGLSY